MRKLVDDVRLIFKCCSLYYQDGVGQKEICQMLGISRPTVSRMLSLGKELGIVKIEIQNPDNEMYGQLERELEKSFGLQEVVIVPSSPLIGGKERINSDLGRATLHFLSRVLRKNDYVGISMGLTMQNVVRAEYFIEEEIHCVFVPILGGIGESRLDIHSNYIAQEFADRFGGECVQFFSPAVFSKRELMEDFLKEKTIQRVIALYQKLDLVIMGIGVPSTEYSTILNSGYVDRQILEKFTRNGAVGDIALRYFDAEGNTEAFKDFNERVSGITLEQLGKVPRRIGVASGTQKVEAVKGAIRGKYINILITDIECAEGLLK